MGELGKEVERRHEELDEVEAPERDAPVPVEEPEEQPEETPEREEVPA